MSIPPLRKWRPGCHFYRCSMGWQFFVHPHKDYNPILFVSRWLGRWTLEIFKWRWSNDPGAASLTQ